MAERKRELLFSLTSKDFEFETFKGSGPGGQHRNKTESCVRCYHRASESMGSCCEHREQLKNKRIAFERMAKSPKFQGWLKVESARRTAGMTVEDPMDPKNLRIEVKKDGKWVLADENTMEA